VRIACRGIPYLDLVINRASFTHPSKVDAMAMLLLQWDGDEVGRPSGECAYPSKRHTTYRRASSALGIGLASSRLALVSVVGAMHVYSTFSSGILCREYILSREERDARPGCLLNLCGCAASHRHLTRIAFTRSRANLPAISVEKPLGMCKFTWYAAVEGSVAAALQWFIAGVEAQRG
jgi:hypothetical protein